METARIDLEGLVERCPQGPKGIRVTGTAFLFVCFVLCFSFFLSRTDLYLWERDLRKNYMGHWDKKRKKKNNEIEGPPPPLMFSIVQCTRGSARFAVLLALCDEWERTMGTRLRDIAIHTSVLQNGVTQSPLPAYYRRIHYRLLAVRLFS